jgi:hypothetical protein
MNVILLQTKFPKNINLGLYIIGSNYRGIQKNKSN